MMSVVLDTSVLVAAARSSTGASQRLLRLLPDARFQPVISVPLFAEYSAVLTRGVAQLASSWVRSTRNFSGSGNYEPRDATQLDIDPTFLGPSAPGLKQAGPPL